METLGRTFVRVAKSRTTAFCMADSTGQELTYGRALVGAPLLSRLVRRLALDADGFIDMTDRLSRFSKIAGEMVPHMTVEEVQGRAADGVLYGSEPDAAAALGRVLPRERRATQHELSRPERTSGPAEAGPY